MDSCKILHIKGMKCISCEAIIADELKDVAGLTVHEVDSKSQRAVLSFDGEMDVKLIKDKLNKLGYQASFDDKIVEVKQKVTIEQWFWSLVIVGGIYILYKLISFVDLGFNAFDMSNVTLGVAFIIGIVASMSTCLAIVGAVVVSFAARYESRGTFFQSNVKPHLLFHAGRLSAFLIFGALLGFIGSWFSLSASFMGWFTIIIAIILIWLGLQILGFAPSLSSVGLHLPRGIMKQWNQVKNSNHPLAPIVLGGMTFFLPCGFTQSMQLFAIASGSIWIGALTMMFFALGTTPVLLGIGIATTKFKNLKSVVLNNVIGMVVMIFAFFTLSSGLAMAGINLDLARESSAQQSIENKNYQEIRMTVDYNGFTPNQFILQKGVPVRWIIDGKQVSGCTNEIIVPDLNIRKKITSGENIVEFTPQTEGVISFSCWMGMVRGKFIVK
jgi:sulfite exporter TauE/SafE/copper chaperone CopZ